MKFVGQSPPLPESDERTRDRIAQVVLRRGPVTVADIAEQLELTAAGVRRQLDQLQAAGLVTTWETTAPRQRGRGRPARAFVLTDTGHAEMTTGYGDLATSALRYLADVAGPDAVRRFADLRVADLEQRHRDVVEAAGDSPSERATALGLALPVARVIVNQVHCFATGGSYDNGLPFSLSMGCGTWGRNSFSDNLNYRHFLNVTRIATPLPPERVREPTEDELFGDYRRRRGR